MATEVQKAYHAAFDSAAEEAFAHWWQVMGTDEALTPQYRFHPTRGWRFDFAFPGRKVAIEIDGVWGTDGKSRHTNPVGYMADMEKLNDAAQMHWCVLRFPAHWLNTSSFAYLPSIYDRVKATLAVMPAHRIAVTADSAALAGL